jgi:DNA-binding Xre family transcriptional regulator
MPIKRKKGDGARRDGHMTIVLTLGDYLKKLEGIESDKPPAQRRPVPSVAELAEAAEVHRATMYNMVNGQVKLVNLESLSAVFNELRDRGFEVDVSDLLKAFPTDSTQTDKGSS